MSSGSGTVERVRRQWTSDLGDPAEVVSRARNALFVMVGVLAVIWIVQIVNAATGYSLTQDYGIVGLDVARMPDILSAPFLHFSWAHIEGNSGPLFIFGFIAAYRGLAKFAGVTAIVILTSGFAAWFFEGTHVVGAGASGVVFGYFGYIMVRGFFDRHPIDMLVGAVMALCFAWQFSVLLLPHAYIGWQAHIGGLVGGILSGWIFRDHRAPRAVPARKNGKTAPAAWPTPGTAIDTAQPSGKKLVIDSSNPRAELHKQLDDLGL